MTAAPDATRVASYNPWVSLAWLTTGETVGGLRLYGPDNLLGREAALRLWTEGSAWFSNDDGRKGRIAEGWLADFLVPSQDYFAVPDAAIRHLTSHLTVVGGRVVHGDGAFGHLAPPLPAGLPDWSPVLKYGGYQHREQGDDAPAQASGATCCASACGVHGHALPPPGGGQARRAPSALDETGEGNRGTPTSEGAPLTTPSPPHRSRPCQSLEPQALGSAVSPHPWASPASRTVGARGKASDGVIH